MKTLYQDLMNLCSPVESPFYFVDHILEGITYRVFTYRLGQYSDFLLPNARECRGHMFRLDETPVLVSLPQNKFFNLNENPFTMDLDFSKGAELIMDKVDGSLISTYLHKGVAKLKSKTSLSSEQAVGAMDYLKTNATLQEFVQLMVHNGYTVNMEWTAPQHRIVVPYQTENLTVLNVRNNETGEYMGYESIKALMDKYGCVDHLVMNVASTSGDVAAFLASVPFMGGQIEGFVVKLRDGETFKVKTNQYVSLHRLKDSITSPRRLYEVVVNEAHDDAKAAFANDPYIVGEIEKMEKIVAGLYTDIKYHVDGFYNKNHLLDRKSFAILAQTEVPKPWFGLAMNMYVGKENDYKAFLIKNYKEFGIKDDAPEEIVE